MKDALGHGSDAHQSGVDQVGKLPLTAEPMMRGTTAAGNYKISTKDPETLTNSALLKEYEALGVHSSAIGRDLINSGRGMERPSDRVGKTDDLSRMYRAISDRMEALSSEHRTRSTNGGRRVRNPETGQQKFVGGVPDSLRHGSFR